MSKKITKQTFLERFKLNFPEAEIEIIEYTAISKPAIIRCKKCGKVMKKKKASNFLNCFSCCKESNLTKLERIKKIYSEQEEFEIIKVLDKDNIIIKHNKCGNEIKRNIQATLLNPYSCKKCESHKHLNMLSVSEIQDRLDSCFNKTIKILEYNGQLEKNKYKCLKCGFIFNTNQVSIMQSKGCPKCDRFKSRGEKSMAKYLDSLGIKYQEQVKVPELPRQKFDFALYDNNFNIIGFIEVNGEQHYYNKTIFDSLETIQERDERKRKYCKERNLPLYEIKWFKGRFLNLDILPFSSTTISAKESTL